MFTPLTDIPARIHRGTRDVVVIGGSAGGLPAAVAILSTLPADLPASVLVALHRRSDPVDSGGLASVFARNTRMRVMSAWDGAPLEQGVVYVAPPDLHLLLANGRMRVQDSPRENTFRPCINVLLKSAAATYGQRVIGILLSGIFGNDGAAGLWSIRERGGIAIVQDPADADHPGMPRAALEDVAVDYVIPAASIGPKLIQLVCRDPARQSPPRLLIVEDESVVATNLMHSLGELGYDVLDWVPTGEAAEEIAARERPDLILMDLHLAGARSGIETARRIWEGLQIPIVFCTAHADLATLREVETVESYGYVVKPFQTPAVRAAIELALARRERELR